MEKGGKCIEDGCVDFELLNTWEDGGVRFILYVLK